MAARSSADASGVRRPSLALLLALAGSLAGCIDPKSIGIETDGESSGPGDSGSAGEESGSTGPGQTTSQTTAQTSDSGTDDSGLPCPPIEIPPCVQCECIDGEWACDESTCAPDCVDQACGTACLWCPDGDPDCATPDEGVCTADGQCVGVPPPKLGFCEGALLPGFEDELDTIMGCADVLVFARDAADERGLVLSVDQGLFAAVQASGMPVHVELPATDPSVSLEGLAGYYVTGPVCSDVIISEPDIKETWLPHAGTVIVDVVPFDDANASATVQLVGVELRRVQPGPAPIVVDLTWNDVIVGWFPG